MKTLEIEHIITDKHTAKTHNKWLPLRYTLNYYGCELWDN